LLTTSGKASFNSLRRVSKEAGELLEYFVWYQLLAASLNLDFTKLIFESSGQDLHG